MVINNFFKAQQKAIQRSWHNHSMHLLKYEKFLNKLKTIYEKRICGIKATCQIIKRSDRLRKYYKKGRKRASGAFTNFKNKHLIPIWTRPKHIDLRENLGIEKLL